MGDDTIRALATTGALAIGADPDAWGDMAVALAPIITMSITLHQRSGATRPYNVKPNHEAVR